MHSISFSENNEKAIEKVFIIDNNSSDASLKKSIKTIKFSLYKNKENKGFQKHATRDLNYVHLHIYYC